MIFIIFIKLILVLFSVITLGVLPLIALLNMWIWNEIVVVHVFTCAKPIESFWIMLGLTASGFGITGIVAPLSKVVKHIFERD